MQAVNNLKSAAWTAAVRLSEAKQRPSQQKRSLGGEAWHRLSLHCMQCTNAVVPGKHFSQRSIASVHRLSNLAATSASKPPCNGGRKGQIPAFEPRLGTSQRPSPKSRDIFDRARIHHHNMAESERSPTPGREAHYARQEEHERLPPASHCNLLCKTALLSILAR